MAYVDRGYAELAQRLTRLGATVKRMGTPALAPGVSVGD